MRIRPVLGPVAAFVAFALALPAGAAAKQTPRAETGSAAHVTTSSALLTAKITPDGVPITYYFAYGPTPATGAPALSSQTPPATIQPPVASAPQRVKVGQTIARLLPNTSYSYEVVATYPGAPRPLVGRLHSFRTKGGAVSFEVPKAIDDVYGSPVLLAGTLHALGSPMHGIALAQSPFPYVEAFAPLGATTTTNALGQFAFRVAHLTVSTQLRLNTTDPLPIYSHVITVLVQPRVTLHVRRSSSGLVRLYGTITPAVHAARVELQVQKLVRGKLESKERYVGQFVTLSKKGPGNSSRFSLITKVKHGGRYRAAVILRSGPLASGYSGSSVLRAG